MRARATDHQWTLLSAQAVLRGMYPEQWLVRDRVPQVFPVHVNVDEEDLLLLSPRNCPVYKFQLEDVRPRDPRWRRLLNDTSDWRAGLRSALGNATGQPDLASLDRWDFLRDPVECALYNHVPLPSWLSREDAEQVLAVGDEVERLSYPASLGGLLGGNMMQHFLGLMDEAVAGAALPRYQRPPLLHLFAGHRETISALLSVLGQEVFPAPRFGFHVELELYRQQRGGAATYRVRARLNSEKELIRLCGNRSDADGTCELAQFAAEMRAKMAADWGLTCQRDSALRRCEGLGDGADGMGLAGPIQIIWSPVNGLWYVVSLAAGLLVVGMGVLVFWKWMHHARVDDVPEEIPLQPMRRPRGPKQFTLE